MMFVGGSRGATGGHAGPQKHTRKRTKVKSVASGDLLWSGAVAAEATLASGETRVKDELARRRWSQADLARRLGVDRATVDFQGHAPVGEEAEVALAPAGAS